MSQDVVDVLQALFGPGFYGIWRLFVSWYIPGTKITPAMWALFSLVLVTAVRFVKRLMGGDTNENK